MKRIAAGIAAVLLLVSGCSDPEPVIVSGSIKGYDGSFSSLATFFSAEGVFFDDSITVSPDGTFYYEKMVEKPVTGFISTRGRGTQYTILLPGETYKYEIDLSVNPAIWNYEGRNKAEQDFYVYFKDTLSTIGRKYPETFKECAEFWDARGEEVKSRISTMKNRQAIRYFEKRLPEMLAYNKFNFVWQLRQRGLALDSDEDYNAFFNSIDLTDESNVKGLLSRMISVKKTLYPDSIPEISRELAATRELSPTRAISDSLCAKYITNILLDGKITTMYEADVLTEEVDKLITDEGKRDEYHAIIEKAKTLFTGSDAIDFEIVDTGGKVHRLSDFKGKVVYIDFWATWCLPCCLEIPHMEKIAARYAGDSRIVCMSVSFDKDLDNWREKLDMDKPQWPQYRTDDAGQEITLAYGFRGIPRFMLFDKEGKIVTVYAPRPSEYDSLTSLIGSVLAE